MKYIGYIRVSTDKQDSLKQRHLLLEYAQKQKFVFDEIIEVSISATAGVEKRRLIELQEKLSNGDQVVTAELSRFGRNMLQTLQIVADLDTKGVGVTFIRQPELSTSGRLRPLLLAIYGYLAQSEREFLSLRTKQGLAALKARGGKLGRPTGAVARHRLDGQRDEIACLIRKGVSLTSISKIVECPLSTLRYFVRSRSLI